MRPPELLIFFHLPKTAGTTMNFILEHCFSKDRLFCIPESSIEVGSHEKIAAKYDLLSPEAQRSIQCVMGGHMEMGIHTIFDRPAKYFTIVRHPVNRVVSEFYYCKRTQNRIPHQELIRSMTLDQYVHSRIGLESHDLQVRWLSGCLRLNGDGASVPVGDWHLQQAKQNIKDQFITAAPLEEFNSLVVFLVRLYNWPLRKSLFERQNVTPKYPRIADLPAATVQRIEDNNRYDTALYEWVEARFAKQLDALGPQFLVDRILYNTVNRRWQKLARKLPEERRCEALKLLYS